MYSKLVGIRDHHGWLSSGLTKPQIYDDDDTWMTSVEWKMIALRATIYYLRKRTYRAKSLLSVSLTTNIVRAATITAPPYTIDHSHSTDVKRGRQCKIRWMLEVAVLFDHGLRGRNYHRPWRWPFGYTLEVGWSIIHRFPLHNAACSYSLIS